MRLFLKTILLTLLFLVGCQNKKNIVNQFSSYNDTIVIETQKQKGSGLFQLGAGKLQFKNTSEIFSYAVKYPNDLENLKHHQLKVDFREKKEFNIDIIKANKDNQQVIIVDENNNNDLTDDSIRPYEKFNWNSTENLIKCEYSIFNGKEIVKDSSWLRIGKLNNMFFLGKSEHLLGEFQIDNEEYKIGIIETRNSLSFTYGVNSELTLLSNLGVEKDSISKRDLLKLGEFLNLNGQYYRFEKISNNGELITLVKEKNFMNKIGTQLGMIAPPFEVVTIFGDTIRSSDLNNKITVIANSCGCGGDKKSTDAFYEMEKLFGNKMNILHVDSNIEKPDIGTHIDSEEKFNKDFYNNYRKEYCSRICYVIGKENRIIDKFNVNDWSNILPKIIKNTANNAHKKLLNSIK